MSYAEGETNSGAGSFAAEFEKYMSEKGNVKPGKVVRGRVISVGKDVVTVDIGFKSEGVVPVSQFADADGVYQVKLGDEIDVFIIAVENEYGQLVLSYEKAEQKRVWDHVEDLYKKGGTITGKVVMKVKGGLQLDIGIPAFLPGSQIDIRPHRNIDKFIGESFECKVLKITRDKGNIVLSRRAVLMSERDSLRAETLKVLQEGVVMEGVVKNITDYGVFIDLGGIDGLLHITDISWGRVNHPADKLSVGQTVPVVVLKYDESKERVSLGMKQLTPDPWTTVHERFPVSGKVTGKVISVTDYGAFVELEDGVEGLIHVSEMSWNKKLRNPGKIVQEGNIVEAVILGIDADQQKITLSLRQLQSNPWDELKIKHPVGSRVTGTVRSITDFGVFVGIDDGIDGLVHVSDLSWTKRIKDPKELQEMFKKGDQVEALVLDIDAENERLSLGLKQLESDPWETIAQRYPVDTLVKGTVSSITDFGVFLDIGDGLEGLIHNSHLGLEKGEAASNHFKVGDVLEAQVISIDREERRMSLSLRTLKKRKEKDDMSGFMDDAGSGVTFGDLIRQKMEGN